MFSLFLRCDEFDSAELLRAVFTTTDLAPFADGLPDKIGNKKAFVTEVKSFLLEKRLADGRVLLLPFLETMRGRYSEQDALHGELNDLYQRVLPRIQPASPTSNDVPDTLRKSSAEIETTRPIPPNPFVPWHGRLADDALFCGRERELRELTGYVASRQSVSLLGESRVGKSSLLYQLIGRARRLSPAPESLYMNMALVEDDEDFYESLLKKLGGTGDTWRAFREAIRGRFVLLALDGFERAQQRDLFRSQLRQGLRALAEDGLPLVIITRQPLDRLFADSSSEAMPLSSLCQRYPLSPLSMAEARSLITIYLTSTGVRFGEDEIAEALVLSGGHPGRLQQIGWHLCRAHSYPDHDWRAAYRADPLE